jgi:hypothetical protein
MDGAAKKSGYDSHLSPDQVELVIFNSNQILPCYIVHYGSSAKAVVNAAPFPNYNLNNTTTTKKSKKHKKYY